MSTLDGVAEEFAGLRPHLAAVAYRLTGSVSDAEDAVQESWLRLSALGDSGRAEIKDLRAWLTTVVGRICLDRLRSAAARREKYVGEWLPEPIVTPLGAPPSDDPLEAAVRDEGVRMAAMIVLDRLTPEQRVAFVLHDAFSVPFDEIAGILGISPASARQHASRGRRALDDAQPPPRASMAEQQEVLNRFVAALVSGDVRALAEVLHPDVVLIGDSDGKAKTTVRVMAGADKILRFFQGLLRMYRPGAFATGRPVLVNGDLGVYLPPSPGGDGYKDLDAHLQTVTIRDGLVTAVYDQANPDKLTRLAESGTRPRT
ncbi:sigma-70 family RNA polymerase sigma factor [Amycolatopsis thermophila]|uniref:RNA polymerase sigma-70 factor (ECF subfamily) n=1 Tax=Amycolatopsis thermophila TaxID=206084 RepID=A0ABU0ELX4_9PSEU|nr:sigma-70 family RNA polymerase sigma factor [Amycolatopsis thermophila]MDQ0376289.1 RNA polymerase sigma-70 factor (ECF subfamily) [Amycolatopsis thermophila]